MQLFGRMGAVGAGPAGSEEAGIRMLKAGGNAIDAGVASVLALSVTDSGNFCFGGEVPALIYSAETKKVSALSGQGPAPKKATLEVFHGMTAVPGNGILSAAVPSALATCLLALVRFGTMTFGAIAAPTLEILAKGGQEWYSRLAATLERLIEAEAAQKGNGRSAGIEAVRRLAYEGAIAKELVEWNQRNGGLFSEEDLSGYRARIEPPVRGTYRGYEVFKCGFWTQGPAFVQALNLLEAFDLRSMCPDDPNYVHLVIESLKLAFADRDAYYGDPDFTEIPADVLLSKEYSDLRRTLIDPNRASLTLQPGDPWNRHPLKESQSSSNGGTADAHDTTTCVAADADGNLFVATPSGWGSGVMPGSTGIVVGTRLQSLNLWEGHPNVLRPGKRPRITLTPTLALRDGAPYCVISVAGGDQQDQTALQTFLNLVEFDLLPQAAAETTRFGTNHFIGSFRQTPPILGSLTIENTASEPTRNALLAKGHRLQATSGVSSFMVVIQRQWDGSWAPGGDVRKGRHVAAF